MQVADLNLASFNAQDTQYHASPMSMKGMPYVTDPGLYRATIMSARFFTRNTARGEVPVVMLTMIARHEFTEGHTGRLNMSVFIPQQGDAPGYSDNLWRELVEACGAVQEVRGPDGTMQLLPHLESRTETLEFPDARGNTTAEHITSFEGKEIALVVELGKPYNGRQYLNARVFLNKDLLHYTEVRSGVTKPKLVFERFTVHGVGRPLDYPNQVASDNAAATMTPAAPAYPQYSAYTQPAAIPQPAAPVMPQPAMTQANVSQPQGVMVNPYAPQQPWGAAQQTAQTVSNVPSVQSGYQSPYQQAPAPSPYAHVAPTAQAPAQGSTSAQASAQPAATPESDKDDIPF